MLEAEPHDAGNQQGRSVVLESKLPTAVAEAPEGCTIVDLQRKGRRNNYWKMIMA